MIFNLVGVAETGWLLAKWLMHLPVAWYALGSILEGHRVMYITEIFWLEKDSSTCLFTPLPSM
jgi:hypothetical protein